jgi:small subunit ribosomal protein S27Ae
MKKTEFFKVEGDRITRVRKYCPKCGPAVFLADHKDRFSCGKCGYTEFKGGGKLSKPVPDDKKPLEAKTETPAEPPAPEPPSEQATPAVEERPEVTAEEKPVEDKQKDEEPSGTKQKDDKTNDESSDEEKKE